MSRKLMSRKVSRRAVLAGTAVGAAAALTRFPTPAIAQAKPFRTRPSHREDRPARAGRYAQMEQGVITYLKETNYTIGGRKVDFVSADTGGNPAGAKTKAQELIERDKVDVILGPLATFELYAINDYIPAAKDADDEFGRGRQSDPAATPTPIWCAPSATSSQAMQPMGHYAATEMKLKRAVAIGRGSLLRLRRGGRLPGRVPEGRRLRRQQALAAAGYARLHALCRADQRLRRRVPRLCRVEPATLHEGLCRRGPEVSGGDWRDRRRRRVAQELWRRGDRAGQLHTVYARSRHRRQSIASFEGMLKNYNAVPGQYAAILYANCQVVDAALESAQRRGRRSATSSCRRCKAVNLTDTPRGPVKYDHFEQCHRHLLCPALRHRGRQIRTEAVE